MKTNTTVDTARLSLLLNELRLPAIKAVWAQFAEQADKEGWPAARFLAASARSDCSKLYGVRSSQADRATVHLIARPNRCR